jgi:hypothetical protein
MIEGLIGSFFLCISLMLPIRSVPTFYPDQFGRGFVDVGNVLFWAAIVILFAFTQRVFRPDASWARALAMLGSAAVIMSLWLSFFPPAAYLRHLVASRELAHAR